MKSQYLILTLFLLLTSCSSTNNQKIMRPPHRETPTLENCSCDNIDIFINTQQFELKPLEKLYKRCQTPKTKVALLIAKGDNYYDKREAKRAYESYSEALSIKYLSKINFISFI